jgi:hypothetical protein
MKVSEKFSRPVGDFPQMQGKKQGKEKTRHGKAGIGWCCAGDTSHEIVHKGAGGRGKAHRARRCNADEHRKAEGEDDGEIAGGHWRHRLLRGSDAVIRGQTRYRHSAAPHAAKAGR